MVDIGAGPLTNSSVEHFDRARYPVRYYYTNLANAARDEGPTAFAKDVADCGRMIDKLLVNVRIKDDFINVDLRRSILTSISCIGVIQVPRIAPKFKSLVNAMTSGGFGAADSRKLFEARCKSLEAEAFDMPVHSVTATAPIIPPVCRSTSQCGAEELLAPPTMKRNRTRSTPVVFGSSIASGKA
jgi:hypothetical protein